MPIPNPNFKPSVLADCDGVLCDFVTPVLTYANKLEGTNFTYADVSNFDIFRLFGDRRDEVKKEVWEGLTYAEGFARTLKPYAPAIEWFDALKAHANITCVTSPIYDSETWCYDRTQWLKEHFDLPARSVLFTSEKFRVQGDFLIDDSYDNIMEWIETNPEGVGILFARPWNSELFEINPLPRTLRTGSWLEIIEIISHNGPRLA